MRHVKIANYMQNSRVAVYEKFIKNYNMRRAMGLVCPRDLQEEQTGRNDMGK